MNNREGFSLLRDLLGMGKRLRFLVRAAWRPIKRWHQLAADRLKLANLSDVALGELGLVRADVQHDSEPPFWGDPHVKLPRHCKRNY